MALDRIDGTFRPLACHVQYQTRRCELRQRAFPSDYNIGDCEGWFACEAVSMGNSVVVVEDAYPMEARGSSNPMLTNVGCKYTTNKILLHAHAVP